MAQISAAVQKIFRPVPNIGLRAASNQDVRSFLEFSGSTPIERALTEFAARICYNSVKRLGSAPNFVEGILRSGHLSTVEHASMMLPVRAFGSEQLPKIKLYEVNRFFDFPKGYVAGNLRSWLELMALGDYNPLFEYIVAVFPDAFPSSSYVNEVEFYEFAELAPVNVPVYEGGTPNVYLLAVNRGELDVSRRPETKLQNPWVRYTWLVEGVSRSLTHQLVRHRGMSFCLAGDTVVPSFGARKFTMRQLWEYQTQNKNGPLQQLRLRGMDEERRLIPVKIKRVINSGFQQLYRLKTESGRVIRATENHKFLTATEGWKALKDLSVGDKLLANGVGGTRTVFGDKIVTIELDKIEETFDLEIDHQCHNFVAAGLVVHNSQESQRYVDFEKGSAGKNYPNFILPESWSDEQRAKMQDYYENILDTYNELRQDGAKKEDARFILPNAASTRLVVSGNLPELLHFFKLRCAKDAQWEIRRLAVEMLRQAFLATPVPELEALMNEYGR